MRKLKLSEMVAQLEKDFDYQYKYNEDLIGERKELADENKELKEAVKRLSGDLSYNNYFLKLFMAGFLIQAIMLSHLYWVYQ